eukprot:TRINITY_DN2609_c0_g2_i1.p1 TRINITY_DN2609_c0_g2~~TRINITY_DN2609_c0_g2_i1.p1  ORF type:complete len:514 (-),score=35.27 TRINITY_DN2609_c0_g2_i1:175-1659(-)
MVLNSQLCTLQLQAIRLRPAIYHKYSSNTMTKCQINSNDNKYRILGKYDFEILRILLPTIGTMSLDPVMSFVDANIVATLGTAPFAGVGMSAVQITLLTNLFTFFMILTVPEVAKCWVENDTSGICVIVSNKVWLALMCGLVTTCCVVLTAQPFVQLIGAETSVAQHAITYLSIRAAAIPIHMIQLVFVGVFRGCQDAFQPLIAQVLAVIVNIFLDVLFVFVLGWGVGGSAWATVIGYLISCSYLAALLFKKNMIQLDCFKQLPSFDQIYDDLSNGVALSMRNLATFVFFTISASAMAKLGAATQAAYEISRQAFVLFGQPLWSFNPASLAVISKYLSTKQQQEAKQVFKRCLQIGILLSTILGASLITFQHQIISQFSYDVQVQRQVGGAILISGLTFGLDVCSACVEGALAANKQAKQLGFNSVVSVILATVVLYGITCLGLTSVTTVMIAMRIIPLGRLCGNWPQLFFNQPSFELNIDENFVQNVQVQTQS